MPHQKYLKENKEILLHLKSYQRINTMCSLHYLFPQMRCTIHQYACMSIHAGNLVKKHLNITENVVSENIIVTKSETTKN